MRRSAPGSLATVPSPRPTSVVAVALGRSPPVGAATPTVAGAESVRLSGVSLDSRTVQPGDLYAALPGFVAHGASFAAQAVDAGAVAVLTDPRPRAGHRAGTDRSVPVLVVADPRAVLGDVAAQVYGRGRPRPDPHRDHRHQRQDHDGLPRRVGAASPRRADRAHRHGRDPDRRQAHRVGAHDARGDRPARPARAHARGRRADASWRCRATPSLCTGSTASSSTSRSSPTSPRTTSTSTPRWRTTSAPRPPSSRRPSRRGVVCVDDAWGARLAAEATVPVVTLGASAGSRANWVVRQGLADVHPGGPAGTGPLECHLPGDFNVVNTALAALCALRAGPPLDRVAESAAAGPALPGRMEGVTPPSPRVPGPTLLVDFAHTPDAVTPPCAPCGRPRPAGSSSSSVPAATATRQAAGHGAAARPGPTSSSSPTTTPGRRTRQDPSRGPGRGTVARAGVPARPACASPTAGPVEGGPRRGDRRGRAAGPAQRPPPVTPSSCSARATRRVRRPTASYTPLTTATPCVRPSTAWSTPGVSPDPTDPRDLAALTGAPSTHDDRRRRSSSTAR